MSPSGRAQSQSSVHSQPSVRNRTLWESYKGKVFVYMLPARTRLYVAMTVCTVGALGIFISDCLEKKIPVEHPREAIVVSGVGCMRDEPGLPTTPNRTSGIESLAEESGHERKED
ncbi:hypothetical protein L210DRAFT_841305 [Boletus edulis BED1]|uniref:Uncharacterized protein n=1 Tax=Boletus edulis BED1 TaxID=1328754 RepID=A0AAD4C1K6_BOLED|nr:hypothetical protein L210DRAFT_841305 [Boletus edulis BED1]